MALIIKIAVSKIISNQPGEKSHCRHSWAKQCQVSNPGRLVAKLELFFCAMPSPFPTTLKSFFYFPYFALTLVCCEMAWLGIIFLNLRGYARITQLIVSGSIYFYLQCPRRKTIWSELELNQGPLVPFVHKRPL